MAGNLGQNSNYKASFDQPMTIIGKDIDNNGSFDAMIFCYAKAEDGTMKLFPMHTRDDMISQVLSIRKKFPTYKAFGAATMNDIWSEDDKKGAVMMTATDMNTSFVENKGNGKFEIKALPLEAQEAPVYGMLADDLDHDGFLDLVMVGNDYSMEPFTGRHDAFYGLYFKGDGKGGLERNSIDKTGFFVKGDGKALAEVHSAKGYNLWIATQNQDSLKVFEPNLKKGTSQWIKLNQDDFYEEVIFNNKPHKKIEFHYGSTYLAQSTRIIALDKDASEIYIYNFKGEKRKVK